MNKSDLEEGKSFGIFAPCCGVIKAKTWSCNAARTKSTRSGPRQAATRWRKIEKRSKFERGVLTVIGGGLAGCEAAWQAAQRGLEVELFEMRPLRSGRRIWRVRGGGPLCAPF